jgi:hypothetical protein
MAARSNAASELTRLWLEYRHGCIVRESLQVTVPSNYSDIDFAGIHRTLGTFKLPDGSVVGPRIIVETKDEHDGPTGRVLGNLLRADLEKLSPEGFIKRNTSDVKYTMLKEEHFDVARAFFDSAEFDRIFVIHALDDAVRAEVSPSLAQNHRIHWMTIPELASDLRDWYVASDRPTRISLRNTLAGDLFHLLVGFCGFGIEEQAS